MLSQMDSEHSETTRGRPVLGGVTVGSSGRENSIDVANNDSARNGSAAAVDDSPEETAVSIYPAKATNRNRQLRAITRVPRLLGRRIKHLLRDELYLGISFRSAPELAVATELGTLEKLHLYHRWLRGVLALLAIIVFLLTLVPVGDSPFWMNLVIFILSQGACLVIAKTYEVKAQLVGITNALFKSRNIFTSPFFFHMVVEIVLWNIQTPPIVVFWPALFNVLNYFLFLRLYAVVLYLSNATYTYRTFCKAMAAVSGVPLGTFFFIRTTLAFHAARLAAVLVPTVWLSIAFLYHKAEGVPVSDGLWFSFEALAILGYGDYTPLTVNGRAVVLIAWGFSFIFFAYTIAVASRAAATTAAITANQRLVMFFHIQAHTLHDRAAWTIQSAWQLHRARHVGSKMTIKQRIKMYYLSLKLLHVTAAFHRTQQRLRSPRHAFRETVLSGGGIGGTDAAVHTASGLTSAQLNEYVYRVCEAVRHEQRIKDVNRVHMALRDRNVLSSALTRADVESMILLQGLEGETDGAGLQQSCTTSPQESVTQWEERIRTLEDKCRLLSELLDTAIMKTAIVRD